MSPDRAHSRREAVRWEHRASRGSRREGLAEHSDLAGLVGMAWLQLLGLFLLLRAFLRHPLTRAVVVEERTELLPELPNHAPNGMRSSSRGKRARVVVEGRRLSG